MEYTIRTIRNLVPAMLLSIVAACTDNAGIAEERAEGNFCIKATVSDAIMVRGINGTVKSGEYRFPILRKTELTLLSRVRLPTEPDWQQMPVTGIS